MNGRKNTGPAGFTLVEVVLCLAIISALASVALPNYLGYRHDALRARCQANRHHIEAAERDYFLSHNQTALEIPEKYACPSGGEMAWIITDPGDAAYPRAGCSVHYFPSPNDPMTGIDGFVAGFTLDEGDGGTARIGEYLADINGAQWTDGKSGSALSFDGKNDYVATDIADWSGPFTVMTWVRALPSGQDQYDSIFSSGANGPNKNNFQIDTDGKGNYRFLGGNGATKLNLGAVTSDWQLIAVTFDGDTATTYRNGTQVDSGKWNGTGEFTDYVLGRNRNKNKNFGGTIDELGIFNRPLDADEIRGYYDATQ